MEQLETIKMQLTNAVAAQLTDLQNADTHELYEAIDMIKDLAEAMYYCTITEAMKKEKEEPVNYYTEPRVRMPYYQEDGMMRTNDNSMSNRNYMGEKTQPSRSETTRKMYMESKELHHDKTVKMAELDKYMKELTTELVEMIQDSSPEEKQLLQQKLATLSNKVAQLNV